jgi:outer membrane protein assembly factor BamB
MSLKSSAPRFTGSRSACASFIFLTSLILLIFLAGSCGTGKYKFKPESMYWLQFRGPNACGIAPADADPPVHFSPDTNLLWKTEILPGWSSPCIVNDRIFLTGFNRADSTLHTFAINRENGALIWADSVSPDTLHDIHPVSTYANPTITSDGTRIFSHFPCYGLLAYKLDGEKCWEYTHPPMRYSQYGGCSPVVRDSVVLYNVSIWPNPRIQAQDCITGDSLWVIQDSVHYYTLDVTDATPVFWDDLLIMHQNFSIVAYNLKKLAVEWWYETPSTAVSTPVLYGDIVIIGTWTNFGEKSVRGLNYTFEELITTYDTNHNMKVDQAEIPDSLIVFQRPESRDEPRASLRLNEDRMLGYDTNGDGAFDRDEWNRIMKIVKPYMRDHGMLALPVTGSGELSDTVLLWKVTDNTPETPSPLVVGERVFFVKNGGIMTVIEIATGEVISTGRIGSAGAYISSPMLAANRIYTCSYNGVVTVLSAEDFSVLAHNRLGEKIGASPVAVDDVLYVRTSGHLYAFRDPG